MSGSNVVPMPMHTPWPMPPSGFPAGCCPPGGMDALLQCYCDIQAATAFISKVVQNLAATDPAFIQSIVDGIAKSGSNIPLIGVTNGADAQPGQVGEFINFVQTWNFNAGINSQTFTMGILQPGDWNIWFYSNQTTEITYFEGYIPNPIPTGFTGNLWTNSQVPTSEAISLISTQNRALISVPTLVALFITFNATTAGAASVNFNARRLR